MSLLNRLNITKDVIRLPIREVFVVRDDKAVMVPVTPGARVGDVTAVAGNVKSGDKAVLRPPGDLADGALVRVAAK